MNKPILIDFKDLLFELLVNEDELLEVLYAYFDTIINHGLTDKSRIANKVFSILRDPIVEEENKKETEDFRSIVNVCVNAIFKVINMHVVDFSKYNEYTITEEYAVILH